MTAFLLHLDAHGHVCGGHAQTGSLSSETWSMKHIPIVELPDADIAWPNGERWAHIHIAQRFPEETPSHD
ncbi:MAG: hypothetical protein ACYC3L_01205 [Gemmatimonadaceae bacterium]